MATTGVDETFVDTNVLVYATDSLSPFHRVALAALQRVIAAGSTIIISPQIISEYLSVALRSSLTSSMPSVATVFANVQAFRRQFRVVEENDAVVTELLNLLQAFPIAGRRVHDANIVATMRAHGMRRLLTHNVADFTRFTDFIIVVPLQPTS